jgi:hypothetical protein
MEWIAFAPKNPRALSDASLISPTLQGIPIARFRSWGSLWTNLSTFRLSPRDPIHAISDCAWVSYDRPIDAFRGEPLVIHVSVAAAMDNRRSDRQTLHQLTPTVKHLSQNDGLEDWEDWTHRSPQPFDTEVLRKEKRPSHKSRFMKKQFGQQYKKNRSRKARSSSPIRADVQRESVSPTTN